MVIVNCCSVQICTVIIYIMLHVYLDNIKTGMWPEEIESFHARRTMVAPEEGLGTRYTKYTAARVPFIIRTI